MFRIIKFLFTGVWAIHQHEWVIIDTRVMTYKPNLTVLNYGTTYVMQCKLCGDIKEFRSTIRD